MKKNKFGLLPCPFCNSENVFYEQWERNWAVFCNDCFICTTHYSTKKEAKETWNRRVENYEIDYLETKVKELNAMCKIMGDKLDKIRDKKFNKVLKEARRLLEKYEKDKDIKD